MATRSLPSPYYTLITFDIATGWSPQYGSYERHDCVTEMEDYQYSQGLRRKDMRIVATDDDTQAAIDAVLRTLNSEGKAA